MILSAWRLRTSIKFNVQEIWKTSTGTLDHWNLLSRCGFHQARCSHCIERCSIRPIKYVKAVKILMHPLPALLEVLCFRVHFRFQPLSPKCFRFQKNLTASASTSLLSMKQLIVFNVKKQASLLCELFYLTCVVDSILFKYLFYLHLIIIFISLLIIIRYCRVNSRDSTSWIASVKKYRDAEPQLHI